MGRRIEFEAEPADDKLFLSMAWISGEGEGVEFDLTCGAGLGSPHMVLSVTVDGETHREAIDIRDGVTDWVNRMAEEMRAKRSEMGGVVGGDSGGQQFGDAVSASAAAASEDVADSSGRTEPADTGEPKSWSDYVDADHDKPLVLTDDVIARYRAATAAPAAFVTGGGECDDLTFLGAHDDCDVRFVHAHGVVDTGPKFPRFGGPKQGDWDWRWA